MDNDQSKPAFDLVAQDHVVVWRIPAFIHPGTHWALPFRRCCLRNTGGEGSQRGHRPWGVPFFQQLSPGGGQFLRSNKGEPIRRCERFFAPKRWCCFLAPTRIPK